MNEIISETIVNKLSSILNKEVLLGDQFGNVLASSDLSKSDANYSQLQKVFQSGETLEITKEDFSFTKNPLGAGVILPLSHQGEIVAALYIQDEPSNYTKYLAVMKAAAELLLQQTMVIDNVPYKDRIKDNFIFGLLHHKLSWDDQRTYDEAELLEVSLHKDKIVAIIYVPGFWQNQFNAEATRSEDEKQGVLHSYKTKVYGSLKDFYGLSGGVQISYFGNDTFVALIDELPEMTGNEMVLRLRNGSKELIASLMKKFDDKEKVYISSANFYRGKDGIVLAYEEAKVALQLGLNFEKESNFYHIEDLGMIAVLAGGNRRWQENFVKSLLTQLDAEKYLLQTVEVFFDENMSLTLTAKKLGIHRNTLLYRLSKIEKLTGLDPRNFNDAVKLRLASILNSLQDKERVV